MASRGSVAMLANGSSAVRRAYQAVTDRSWASPDGVVGDAYGATRRDNWAGWTVLDQAAEA